jgi:hypothetical protein
VLGGAPDHPSMITLDRRQIWENGFGEVIERRRDRSPLLFAGARSDCS